MFSRWLDLVFQYLGRLTLALLVLPAVASVGFLALDRTQVVSTRIWADPPAYVGQDLSPVNTAQQLPADAEISAMTELLATDSFVDEVLAADPAFQVSADDAKIPLRTAFRSSLQVIRAGPNLVVLQVSTTDPMHGINQLNSLVKVFGDTLKRLQLNRSLAADSILQSELKSALADRDAAVANLQAYVNDHAATSPQGYANDPQYVTLSSQAQAKTAQYLSLLLQAQQVALLRAAVPSADPTSFHVVDAPGVQQTALSFRSPVVKALLLTLGGTLAVEVLLIYVIARRDPRIRSGEEAADLLDLPYLGSTRALGA